MKQKRLTRVTIPMLALALVMLASLACGGSATEKIEDLPEPTSPPDAATEPPAPGDPTESLPSETPTAALPKAFEAIPFAAIKSQFAPRREAEPGWDYLYVLVALENVSDEFASLSCCNPQVGTKVVTGEGYSYPAEDGNLSTSTLRIPPGYRMWAVQFPQHYNYFVFKVAEQTNRYQLHLPDLPGFTPVWLDDAATKLTRSDFERLGLPASRIGSPLEDAISETSELDLDELFRRAPSAPDPLQKGEPFQFGESGELTVVSSERQDEQTVMVDMLFRNLSGGYDQDFELGFYVIGDYGLLWERQNSPRGPSPVGPGQELEAQRRFLIPPGAGRLEMIVDPGHFQGRLETPGLYRLD